MNNSILDPLYVFTTVPMDILITDKVIYVSPKYRNKTNKKRYYN